MAQQREAPGLIKRRKQLAAAKKELALLRSSGLVRRVSMKSAEQDVERAKAALDRQLDVQTRRRQQGRR